MRNFGLVSKKINPQEWVLGANSPILPEIICEDGDWTKYIPVFEKQKYGSLETMSCVTQSALNVLEILVKKIYNIDINFSDRGLAKMSNTNKSGNSLQNVAETIRKMGVLLEEDWAFNNNDVLTWDNYYRNIPNELIDKAFGFNKKYNFSHDWIYGMDMREALKYSPLQVTVNAWYKKDGIYYNNVNYSNHAVVLVGYDGDCPLIFDSYEPSIKKLKSDYILGDYAKRFNINIINNMEEYIIKNNNLYQLVSGNGGFAVGLDGRLIIDDLDKLLATFISRNNGDIENKTVKVRQDFWDKFDKVNLKGEKVK